jgi:hypothetical protein
MSANYVNGVIPSVGKRIAQYTFGEDLIKFDFNRDQHHFEVTIKEGVDEDVIHHFTSFWKGFKVLVVQLKEKK